MEPKKNKVLSGAEFLYCFCLPLCGLPVALSLSHTPKLEGKVSRDYSLTSADRKETSLNCVSTVPQASPEIELDIVM